MRSRFPSTAAPLLVALALAGGLERSTTAQYARQGSNLADQLEWENSRLRLTRLAVAPGAAAPAGSDRVLVYLTADPEGRMPAAEAVWQPAGSGDLQNRGHARLEAIAIELKDAPPGTPAGTPPEALSASDRADVWRLIDNSRVLVTKHRYAPTTYVDPLHFHPQDALVVYLRGGYAFPAAADWWGSYRVRRGDVDVIPANTFHTMSNPGGDPLEFLMIMPR
jgi:mannose-6-phosphate isomerase-like protein (cupin superfamily)